MTLPRKPWAPRARILSLGLLLCANPLWAAKPAEALAELEAAYRPQPQGYPTGKEFARPDTSVPFRWHFYNKDAVPRFEQATMASQADSFNPLEGEGVEAARKSDVQFAFVLEKATAGKRALRVTFPAPAIKTGQALVHIRGTAGPPALPLPLICPASNYRWLKVDVFNPTAGEVRVRVGGVPFVLHPGANVVAVKTADASGYNGPTEPDTSGAHRRNPGDFITVPVQVTAPARDVVLYLDNVRLEQEVPATLRRKGKLFQFPAREGRPQNPKAGAPVLWPGFQPVEADTLYTPERGFGWTTPPRTRTNRGLSFRSLENGLIWGRAIGFPDGAFRVDLPNGRHGVYLFLNPVAGFNWEQGARVKLNGQEHVVLAGRSQAELRREMLSGESWDFRPGACVWEGLVRRPYFPPTEVVYAEVTDRHLLIDLPRGVALRALALFPEADKAAALAELGRLNYLLAESWDVAHPWVKGDHAVRARYTGFHDEAAHPETIPDRLRALQLTAADFERGFLLFQRGLTEPVYPDTIPTRQEATFGELHCRAAPGTRPWTTLGLLPLADVKGLQLTVTDLRARKGEGRIPADQVDIRIARYQQKCMEYGHHNHAYNYAEHYLVRRPQVDLFRGAARRAYLGVSVPPRAAPGEYRGELQITTAGKTLARVPVTVEVLPITLQEPPILYFVSGTASNAPLREFGINTCADTYDEGMRGGFKTVVIQVPFQATIKGEKLGDYRTFQDHRKVLKEVIDAGRKGKGPRPIFYGQGGGLAPNPRDPVLARLAEAMPELDILNVTLPVYSTFRFSGFSPADPEHLQAARESGKEFWFTDSNRNSREQAGRFTCGFWLWRVGATGRWCLFRHTGDFQYGTACEAVRSWVPYYALLGVIGSNPCSAVQESVESGAYNPSRDLVLIAEGITDYRYIHTLDACITRAEAARHRGSELAAAKRFRDELRKELSPDLTRYYEFRNGAYAEDWYSLPGNPWTSARFDQVRRQCALHIAALQRTSDDP